MGQDFKKYGGIIRSRTFPSEDQCLLVDYKEELPKTWSNGDCLSLGIFELIKLNNPLKLAVTIFIDLLTHFGI